MSRESELTIVIVTYNSAEHIRPCLERIPRGEGARIVVFDNNSSDDSAAIAEAVGVPGLRVVRSEKNLGFGAAVNAAARGIPGDLLLLNPDARLCPETISELRETLRGSQEVGIVAPAMVYPDGRRGIAGGNKPTVMKELSSVLGLSRRLPGPVVDHLSRVLMPRTSNQFTLTMRARTPVIVDWVSGFCMLVRGKVWMEAGGFSPRYFMYFEDVELCDMARKQGWTVVCKADTEVLHFESASSTSRIKGGLYRKSCWRYLTDGALRRRRSQRLGGA